VLVENNNKYASTVHIRDHDNAGFFGSARQCENMQTILGDSDKSYDYNWENVGNLVLSFKLNSSFASKAVISGRALSLSVTMVLPNGAKP
jgi:hypothetical protein